MPFSITAPSRYIIVRRDGVEVSRNLTVEDAIEAAYAHALEHGNGEYRISYPERVLKAYGVLAVGDTVAPSAPTGLAASNVGATSLTLSWTAATDNVAVTGYTVWQDGVPIGSTASTSYPVTGLAAGTLYSFQVAASDAVGNQSDLSSALLVTTDSNVAPVWQAGPQALILGQPYSLNLNTVCSDADGDTLSYTRNSGAFPAGITLSGTIVSGTPTTVQSVAAVLRASDGTTYTDRSITFTVSLAPDSTDPSVPTALTATAISQSSIRLNWGASTDPVVAGQQTSGLSGYKVYRDGLLRTTLGNVLTYTDTDLSLPGLYNYQYQVSAFDVAGNESALTSAVSAASPPPGTISISTIPTIDFVQGLAGQYADLSAYVTYSGTENLAYTRNSGSGPTGTSLDSATGHLSYDGSSAIGSGTWTVAVVEDRPPPAAGDFVFTEIPPELVTVTGIADTEQLGIYMIDVLNRWTPGDFTRASGWTTATPVYLRLDSNDSIIDTIGNAWIAYNSTTMELTLKANATPADHVVYLEREGVESDRFTIRHLVPTDIWGITGQPAVDKAAFGWTNAVEWDAATADFDGANDTGPARATNGSNSTRGRTFANPRVIFFCGQDLPYQSMNASVGNVAGVNAHTFYYVIGDPRRTPYIDRTTPLTGIGTMNVHASWTMHYIKNLSLKRIGIYQTGIPSDMKANMVIHKVTVNVDSTTGTGDDTFGNSFDYTPSTIPYPSETATDVVTGTLGTYNNCYFQFVDVRRGGRADNTKHHFYMEGAGRAGTYLNCCISAGPRGCSAFKSIQEISKIRNSVLAVAPDYDTGLASATTTERWASALVDVKAASLAVLTNNAIYPGRKTVSGTDYGTLVSVYWRARRSNIGADVPPYPDCLWSPATSAVADWGRGHTTIPGFASGTATFTSDAYWAAVAATNKTSLVHPYTFRKFAAYNTITRILGPAGNAIYRDDGTYPLEATNPQQNNSTVFGTHADWDERSVTFLANNTHTNYASTDLRFLLDEGLSVSVTENGTGNAMRSYFVTFSTGQTGYVRENQVTLDIRAWSESLNAKMTGMGFNDAGNFPKFTLLNPHSDSGNLTGAVVNNVPAVGGTDVHVAGSGTLRDVVVTIAGTWSGTITLQRSVLGSNWTDVSIGGVPVTWIANTTDQTINDGQSDGVYYRAVFKTGEYVSGTATVTLSVPMDHVTSSVLQAFWPAAIPAASRPVPTMVETGGQRFSNSTPDYIAIPAGFEL